MVPAVLYIPIILIAYDKEQPSDPKTLLYTSWNNRRACCSFFDSCVVVAAVAVKLHTRHNTIKKQPFRTQMFRKEGLVVITPLLIG